jgi:hypothetical protein
MAIMLRRQLNDPEKATILQRFGRRCFANGHPIPDGDVVHFDHIRAFASGGQTELDNIAPMCEIHNKAKVHYHLKISASDCDFKNSFLRAKHSP